MQTAREPGGAASRSNVRERAIEIGLKILDSEGSDALTLKRIAEGIGVRPPALHWYFRDRRSLLGELLQTGLSDVVAPGDDVVGALVRLDAFVGALMRRLPAVAAVATAIGAGVFASWPDGERLGVVFGDLLSDAGVPVGRLADAVAAATALLVGHAMSSIGVTDAEERTASVESAQRSVRLVLAGAR